MSNIQTWSRLLAMRTSRRSAAESRGIRTSVNEADLDGMIFALLKPRWQKTAMVVILVTKRCQELAMPISDEEIAARLQVLADSDRIEGIGDLRKWRHSEVRLKD
jgi:hypothetical protein